MERESPESPLKRPPRIVMKQKEVTNLLARGGTEKRRDVFLALGKFMAKCRFLTLLALVLSFRLGEKLII